MKAKRGPSYVRALVSAGHISSDVFSLFMSSGSTGKNYITFGAPDLTQVKDAEAIRYISLEDDLFWATECQGFAFGLMSNNFAVPDLGTQFI